jgi:hypothetical protein
MLSVANTNKIEAIFAKMNINIISPSDRTPHQDTIDYQ